MTVPHWDHLSPRTVENFLSHEAYTLVPLDQRFDRATAAAEIADICNEEPVYHFLFARLLAGRPYTEEDAAGFIAWAQKGWEEGTHFVFLLLSPGGRVAGAIDIKSANVASAEVGYWLGRTHSGVMTNTVVVLAEIAAEAGYRRLHAWVDAANRKSIAVLERAGFCEAGHGGRVGESQIRFERRASETEPPSTPRDSRESTAF